LRLEILITFGGLSTRRSSHQPDACQDVLTRQCFPHGE
jgi:hypothetical protein